MEEIEHRVTARLVLIEAGGQERAIAHRPLQNLRLDDRAFGAALGVKQRSKAEGEQGESEAQQKPESEFDAYGLKTGRNKDFIS